MQLSEDERTTTKKAERYLLPEALPPVEELSTVSWKQKVRGFFTPQRRTKPDQLTTHDHGKDRVAECTKLKTRTTVQENAAAKIKPKQKSKKSRAKKLQHKKFLESMPDAAWAKVRPMGRSSAKRG